MSRSFKDYLNTPDITGRYDTQDIRDNKIWAILSYIAFLFILPLFVNGGKSPYAHYHANQGFLLFLGELVCLLANAALGWIPVFGTILRVVLVILVILYIIQGIINAAAGRARQLPFIGDILHVFDRR